MQAPEDNRGGAGPGQGGCRTRSCRTQSCRGQREASTGGGASSASEEPQRVEVGQQSSVTEGPHGSRGPGPVIEGQVQQARQASSAPPRTHHFVEFSVELPFLHNIDPRLARYYLDMITGTHGDPVYMEYSIYGSEMLVQIQCVDLESLHISATTLIYQLMFLTDTIYDLIPAAQGMPPSDRGD